MFQLVISISPKFKCPNYWNLKSDNLIDNLPYYPAKSGMPV